MIELEFAADAESLGALSRIKPLAASRDGRPRTQVVKTVWHDSPDHALHAAGLALAEQRGAWRLERLVPDHATWLPAHPAPVVADPPNLADLPSPLAPLAAFDGRRITSVHGLDAGPVTLSVCRGVIRAVTDERPAARLCLRGETLPVRAAIGLIAESVPITVPRASLAAEALSLALGSPPPARHTGAPKLPSAALSPAEALRHILGHMTDVILACAPSVDQPDEVGIEAVHQMRVAVRRARSALSVFRAALPSGTLDAVRDGLRTLGRQLGPRRDWDVFIDETLPAVRQSLPMDERLDRLAAAAERQQRDCHKALSTFLHGPEFRRLTIDLVLDTTTFEAEAPTADAPAVTLAEFAAGVMTHRHRKLISAGKHIDELDVPGLHGVRLRAKQVRYAAEMFAALHPSRSADRFIRRLSVLQQRLGVLNDSAVAGTLMGQLGGASGRHAYAAGIVVGFLAAKLTKIRPRIIRAFEKFRRQQAYWA